MKLKKGAYHWQIESKTFTLSIDINSELWFQFYIRTLISGVNLCWFVMMLRMELRASSMLSKSTEAISSYYREVSRIVGGIFVKYFTLFLPLVHTGFIPLQCCNMHSIYYSVWYKLHCVLPKSKQFFFINTVQLPTFRW